MKILIIHNYYQFKGGEDIYVESLIKLLKIHGHNVFLYSKNSSDIKTLNDKIKTTIGLFWNFQINKELESIIKEFKPEIAHFHNIYPLIGATAYKICQKNSIPTVQTIHNYRFMCPKGILFRNKKICEDCVNKKLFWPSILYGCYHQSHFASFFFSFSFFFHRYILRTFKSINLYIFPFQFVRNYYIRHLKISKEKITILPNFVEKSLKKQFKKEDYYLFIGRLSEEKGILELLDIIKTMPDAKLKVIGTGPLRKEVYRYKKYKNIEILGYIPHREIFSHLLKSTGIIIPSLWYEIGFPLVYLEALVNKIPILFKRSGSGFSKKDLQLFIQNRSKDNPKEKKINQYGSDYHYKKVISLYSRIKRN